MKKILKFAFAVVAMAGVVFASASCGKDDEVELTQEQRYNLIIDGDPQKDIEKPVMALESRNLWTADGFNIKWTPAKYTDTTQFVYEVIMFDVKRSLDGSLNINSYSLGRQTDTIFHFNPAEFENIKYMNVIEDYRNSGGGEGISFGLNTYYYYKEERRIQIRCFDAPIFVSKDFYKNHLYVPKFENNKLKITMNFYIPYHHVNIILCDVVDGNISREYQKVVYDYKNDKLENYTEIYNIAEDWSHFVKFEVCDFENNILVEFINNIDEHLENVIR